VDTAELLSTGLEGAMPEAAVVADTPMDPSLGGTGGAGEYDPFAADACTAAAMGQGGSGGDETEATDGVSGAGMPTGAAEAGRAGAGRVGAATGMADAAEGAELMPPPVVDVPLCAPLPAPERRRGLSPLHDLLEDLPDLVLAEILSRLDPADFAVLAQVGSPHSVPVLTTSSSHGAPVFTTPSTT